MGYLDSPKKVPEGVVYIDLLNELVEQKIVLVEHCNSQDIYLVWQKVLTTLLKDERKVKSSLKVRSKCLEKEGTVLFYEGFQKNVNDTETFQKTKELLPQQAFTCSKLTIETLVQVVKYVQS